MTAALALVTDQHDHIVAGVGAQVFTIDDGRVTRLVTYLERERGLAELGLGAQPGASG